MAFTRTHAPLAEAGMLAFLAIALPIPGSAAAPVAASTSEVLVEIFENLPQEQWLDPAGAKPMSSYSESAFGFVRIPRRFSRNALALDRSEPFTLRATSSKTLPAGKYRFRLRAKGLAEFKIDGRPLLKTEAQEASTDSNELLPPAPTAAEYPLRPAPPAHQEELITVDLDAGEHTFALVAVVGGKGLAPFPGDLSVSYARPGEVDRLLGGIDAPLLTDRDWEQYASRARTRHSADDIERRRAIDSEVETAWRERHAKVREWAEARPAPAAPALNTDWPQYNAIDRFVAARAAEAEVSPTELTSDLEFLRRLSLDTTGLVPAREQIQAYLADEPEQRRSGAINRFLQDPSWADHWVSYWQDVLAENPGILKPDLNNTGPFRWYLHQAFLDGHSFDRIVVELIEMGGSLYQGAPRGFGMASLNDAAMAAKADILSQAFLGNKLSCARCHDAPFHPFQQKDLFSMAAMLEGEAVKLPKSATVPVVEGGRQPLVEINLKAGDSIDPHWPFREIVDNTLAALPPRNTEVDSRYALAAMMVSPSNERFSQVVVNRVWKRYLGRGLVEPAEDWSNAKGSHPELLNYLSREFLLSGYDLKHVSRLIFESHAYQRKPVPDDPASPGPAGSLFAGPLRRTMSSEQLVDSLHHIAGKDFDSEELNLNPIGNRPLRQFLNMGVPRRAWQLTALSNERDRPSLALPRAQALVDLMQAYGWRQSRQAPATVRDDGPSPMQTLALANGATGTRATRLSDDSYFTKLSLEDRPLEEMVDDTFWRVLTRAPSESEKTMVVDYLEPYFAGRVLPPVEKASDGAEKKTDARVSWANHFDPESNLIRMQEEVRVQMGDPPTDRLKPDYRERFEDVLWALVNSPEFSVIP